MKTRFWFAFVLLEFLPLQNRSCCRRCVTLVGLASESCSLLAPQHPRLVCDLVTHSMTWQWFGALWVRQCALVCGLFSFTKRKRRLSQQQPARFSCLFSNHPVATLARIPTPSSSSSFGVERMGTPLLVVDHQVHNDGLGMWQAKCKQCRSVSRGSSVHTRTVPRRGILPSNFWGEGRAYCGNRWWFPRRVAPVMSTHHLLL